MGYKASLRKAKSFVGRSWGKAKNFVHGTKDVLDAGINIYSKLKPIADDAVKVIGNERVQQFNQKAQAELNFAAKQGQAFHREIAGNVEKIDALGNDFMNAFR